MFESDYDEVESKVSEQKGNNRGLKTEALLTSEEDYLRMFKALPECQCWVELGSGHGLGPLLFAYHHPGASAIGIEFEAARFEVSEKLKLTSALTNVEFIQDDLLHCKLPIGDIYYFYFPTGPVLDRILLELSRFSHDFSMVVVESHGDFLPRLRKETWLKEVQTIPISSARHFDQAVVFKKNGPKPSSLHDYSFQKKYLLIEDETGSWIGESWGLEWLKDDQYQLITPPRTFSENMVKKILNLEELEKTFHPALELRHLPELKIVTSSHMMSGTLRKIYVRPSFRVEISSGQQVEWSEIRQIFWENSLCYDSSSGYYSYPHVV